MRSHPNNSHKSIQQILDDQLKAQAQLNQINQNINVLQNQCIGKDWWDGNFVIGWSKYINQEKNQSIHLFPNDKIFSLSNVLSKVSADLINIQMHQLNHNQLHQKTDARKKFKHKSKKIKQEQTQKSETFNKKVKKHKIHKIKRLNNIKTDLKN